MPILALDVNYCSYLHENPSVKISKKIFCSGQTDIHFSKELMHPSWYSYAMRENSPLKENIDKWYFKLLS